jgi:murein DD-endopeptidase MepM/ murein hydrolase activator NlpD
LFSNKRRLRRLFHARLSVPLSVAVCGTACAAAGPALAQDPAQVSGGGVSAPGDPVVEKVVCKTQCVAPLKATPGALVKVRGEFLDYIDHVVFRGASGPLRAPLTYRDATRVKAVVPEGAVSSRPFVVDSRGVRSNRAPRKLQVLPVSEIPTAIFPIRGPHDYGDAGARFGAARSGHTHQGQDVMAACGTKLVSAFAGRVQYRGYQGAAGNYVVIDAKGLAVDNVYMHMRDSALVAPGQVVGAGQAIGFVGHTGDAEGCHLHFEYWKGDWYGGGHPVDPLPFLKAWDKTS